MNAAATDRLPTNDSVPIRIPTWAWALAAAALFTVFLILQENGTFLSADQAGWLHEFTHDGRHALAVPCH
jgi:hypothetical protein